MTVQKPSARKPTKIKIGEGPEKSSFFKSLLGDKASGQNVKENMGINASNVAVAN